MNGIQRDAQRGFTLFELLIGSVISAVLVGTAIAVVTSTNRVSEEDNLQARVESTHRRSTEFICNVLRNASTASLKGLDPVTSTTDAPRFQRPTGSANGVALPGEEETLVWRASGTPVPGVPNPGDVWLVTTTSQVIAAARVPKDGFVVLQDGRSLIINLTTYHPGPGRRTLRLASASTVCLRN